MRFPASGFIAPIALGLAFLSRPVCGQEEAVSAANQTIGSLHFKTEASRILGILANRWHINIVAPDELKSVVTIDLNDVTVDHAIRVIAAKAGAVYRRIGTDFIVAAPDRITQILETLGRQERVALKVLPTSDAIAQLKQSVPLVTARPFGHAITLIGAPSDLAQARELLRQIDRLPESEPTETVFFTLQHAPAADIQHVLAAQFPLLKAQTVGEAVLALTGATADVARAQEMIRGLDAAGTEDTRYVVYQVRYGSARALAAALQRFTQRVTVVVGPEPYHIPGSSVSLANSSGSTTAGQSGGGGVSGTGGASAGGITAGGINDSAPSGGETVANAGTTNGAQQYGERATTLILGGTAGNVQAAIKLLGSIDVPTPQVVLDVKVVSTNPQTAENLGIDWSNGGLGQGASISASVAEPTTGGNTATGTLLNNLGIGQLGRLPISFTATLNAFVRRDDVRVLAKPTITALNNETGIVFVGETRRVEISSIVPNSGANNVILNNVEEIPVGVSLQMRPRINGNDQVTLFLHPIYSTGGAVDARTGLFSTFQREAATTIRVKSGETVVIGGLLQDEDTITTIKVPLLGDLPLLGQLFRNRTRTHLRREVLVFVTTRILND